MFNKIFHPFLFSLFPILFIYQFNINEVSVSDIFIPLILSIIPPFLIWIGFKLFLDSKKSALITSTIILSFIIYSNLHSYLLNQQNQFLQFFGKHSILGMIFLLISIVIIIIIIKKNSISNLNPPLNVMSITIVGIILVSIFAYQLSNPIDYGVIESIQNEKIIFPTQFKSDIYFLIFDEFAGINTLKLDFNHDITIFEKELKKLNFQIPKHSYSNYPNTELSLPSFLNLKYLDFLTNELGVDSKDFRIPQKMTSENIAFKILKNNGYDITTFYAGMGHEQDVRLIDEKLCNSDIFNPDLKKNFVLTYLPITFFNEQLLENNQRQKLECFFNTIESNYFENSRSDFIYAHLRLPHEPFIYDENGSPTNNLKDDSAYLSQLKFTQNKMLEIIKNIQDKSPDSVIIIMSDHGYRNQINWEKPEEIDFIRGFNNITYLYFPNTDYLIPNEITAVNIFRILFNVYFDSNFEILDNRNIWYSPDRPFDFIEIENSFKEI